MTVRPILPYAKIHVHQLDDLRFMRLDLSLLGRWTQLMMLARKCDAGGAFVQNGCSLTTEDIALLLRCQAIELNRDLEQLKSMNLLHLNGRGWEMTDYETEQGPDDEVKREYWKAAQARHRAGKKTPVNDSQTFVNDSQGTESESESKLKSESEEIVPSVNQSVSLPGLLDGLTEFSKADLVSWAGIPKTYKGKPLSRTLVQDDQLTPADILSELAYNYARQAAGAKIKNPAFCTGLNLLQHQPTPAEYYDRDMWTRHLPSALQTKLGLFIQGAEEESEPVEYGGYTNSTSGDTTPFPKLPIDNPGAQQAWVSAQEQLEMEMPRGTFDAWVRDATLIGYHNGVATIGVPNSTASEWLTARIKPTVERLLCGILDQDTSVRFVTPGDLSGGDTL